MKSERNVTPVVGVALVMAVALSGCAPGASPGGTSSVAEEPSKDLGNEDITLSIVTTPESGAPLKTIVAAFEEEHPT